MKHFYLFFLAFLLGLSLEGCTSLSAESVTAQVVDAATGQPLAGVNVVAYWELHGGSLTGDSLPCGAANVEEAVTDQDGKFTISGWGPVRSSCDMRDGFPLLFLFKSGYATRRLANHSLGVHTVTVSRSDWNGQVIKLSEFPNMDLSTYRTDSYAYDFNILNSSLEYFVVDMAPECNWKKIPNMLKAIAAQQKQFNLAGNRIGSVVAELVNVDQSMQRAAPQCGSPKAFIEGLEK